MEVSRSSRQNFISTTSTKYLVDLYTTVNYNYISGYIARKLLNKVENCGMCKHFIVADPNTDNSDHFLIDAREFSTSLKSLQRPSKHSATIAMKVGRLLSKLLPRIKHTAIIHLLKLDHGL